MVGPASQSVQRDAPSEPAPRPIEPESPVAGPARRRRWPRRVAIIAFSVAATAFAALAIFTAVQHHTYAGRVLPGVEIDGISTAGHREVYVYDSVARLGVTLSRSPVRVRIGHRELSAGPSLLGLTVDARATAQDAMNRGRHGNPFAQMIGTASRWIHPDRVDLHVDYDKDRLEGILDGWSAETDNGEVEGGLRFVGTKVIPIEPHAGSGIVRNGARAALIRMLAGTSRPVLRLPVGPIRPRLDSRAVAIAASRARRLLAGNIVLLTGRGKVIVKPQQLATALGTHIRGHTLGVTVDGHLLHTAIGVALARLESPPVDASFAVTEANTVRTVPSKNGLEIDMPAVGREVLRGLRTISAPLLSVKPKHDTKWAEDLGIVRQVGGFTTEYPSGETRVTNIHRGADLLNNTIVEPGQIFSLNRTVGPRTPARGFVTAPVFAQGEFFDDYGGGVSQLATTTYNAAFFGGYEDITHQPHTIYISRYPPGREATVNYGVIDLEFRNDTTHGILIRTYYSATSITVSLYGDNDGRTVREENRTTTNPVPVTDQQFQCPAAKTVDPHDVCATLPAGQTAQISNGDAGFDVAFDRVITQPGKPERREHYTWHYTMLPNQILVGGNSVPNPVSTLPTGVSSPP